MPRFNLDAWAIDKARREARVKASSCPMCGKPKRKDDAYCSNDCMTSDQRGEASKED